MPCPAFAAPQEPGCGARRHGLGLGHHRVIPQHAEPPPGARFTGCERGASVSTLLWFRGKDLRLHDHDALSTALRSGGVIPLFVLDPFFFAPERARETPYRVQFLLAALRELELAIRDRGSRLVLVAGKSHEVVPRLAREWQVDRVLAQRWCAPLGRERDRRVAAAMSVPLELCDGETLHRPGSLRTQQGKPFAVFGAFARAFHAALATQAPLPAPERMPPLPESIATPSLLVPALEQLGLAHNDQVLSGGEASARERLAQFLAGPARSYHETRDRLDLPATSRLSADLKFGTLSARSVWSAARAALSRRCKPALDSFLGELVWREFAHALLWDHPEFAEEPARPEWESFPWRRTGPDWQAWVAGQTGYPVVDAAARQLAQTGFVPNRSRMIAASFLTKHLLIDYRLGEAHYLRLLTDGDWASNNLGWQWCAGCGSDAAPYFRVFNPTLQARKFDPDGSYVRRWLPELAQLPAAHLHTPWLAPANVLAEAGLRLGRDYPLPIVDHGEARERFLRLAKAQLAR
jgi:deoxyribodipyrimidine photo-lyase